MAGHVLAIVGGDVGGEIGLSAPRCSDGLRDLAGLDGEESSRVHRLSLKSSRRSGRTSEDGGVQRYCPRWPGEGYMSVGSFMV